jgi:hypothetical protein
MVNWFNHILRWEPTIAIIPIIAKARIAPKGLNGAFVVGAGVATGESAAFIWSA